MAVRGCALVDGPAKIQIPGRGTYRQIELVGRDQVGVSTHFMIIPGHRLKFFLIISISSLSVFFPVPNVLTEMERGSGWPITYDT